MEKLVVLGYGMGNEKLLSENAKEIIQSADRILTTTRLSLEGTNYENFKLSEIYDELNKFLKGTTVVIVSGDVCFFSLSNRINEKFKYSYEIEFINGFSSLQYFSAKLKMNYNDIKIVSLHGRDKSIIPSVVYNEKVFALTGGENSVNFICKELVQFNLGYVKVLVGENLSYENEKITTGTAEELAEIDFNSLAVIYVENKYSVIPNMPMVDSDFIRESVPMTKEEVRWICIQKLRLVPNDLVYDIGAGTGSISIEMAKKVYENFVYAIEQKKNACELIRKNIEKHNTHNVVVVDGKAPDAMENLPIPTKAVIGGSTGNMKEIVSKLLELNEEIKIVSTAITLETVNDILNTYKTYDLQFDTVCINVSKAKKVAGYNMMLANNPVYIITGQKRFYE